MKINEALDFLSQSYKIGRKLGLDNVQRLLDRLDNPEKKLKMIHVAGTNGKGSTSSIIYSVLREAGYKVGFYSSPHLVTYNERFRYDGRLISDEDLAAAITRVKQGCEELVAEGYPHPTEFELLTAAGLWFFAKEELDYLIMEVGLGGRLDATNVIRPLISIITPIARDHEDYLGHDLASIAGEKAGIIKEGIPVVSGFQEAEAMEVLENKAREVGTNFYRISRDDLKVIKSNLETNHFIYKGQDYKLPLLGLHQIDNAMLAIEALLLLKSQAQIDLTEAELVSGLLKAQWPGRLEKISDQPPFYIDGGHNSHGIRAVSKILDPEESDKRILLMGMRQDKDYREVLELLLPLFREVVFTLPLGDMVVPVEELVEIAAELGYKTLGHDDYKKALDIVYNLYKEGDQIFSMGSFYLIGEVKEEVLKRKKEEL